jgi:hypothetical protein
MIHWAWLILAFFIGLAFGLEEGLSNKKKKKHKSDDDDE